MNADLGDGLAGVGAAMLFAGLWLALSLGWALTVVGIVFLLVGLTASIRRGG